MLRINGDEMSNEVYGRLTQMIATACNIEPEQITPDSHLFKDLGMDSLPLMDLVYDIKQEFGVKVPLEEWVKLAAEKGTSATDNPFVVRNVERYITELAPT